MSDEDFSFEGETNRMMLLARILPDLRLDDIINTVERAHSLGPFVDPTGYRDALYSGDMDSASRLAEALKPAQKVAIEIIEKHAPEILDGRTR